MTDLNLSKLENDLIAEIKLSPLQASTYLLVNCHGKMTAKAIAEKMGIAAGDAAVAAAELVGMGAFIDMPGGEFEAMHPRFTAVNMYRRYCERHNVQFARNKTVDNIGAALEAPYDDARTGRH